MTRARQDMQDVVLDEGGGSGSSSHPPTGDRARPRDGARAASPDEPADGSPDAGAPVRWRRFRRLWLLGLVPALLAGAAVLDARRDAAGFTDLTDLPAALAPVDGPVRELWRTTDLVLTDFRRVDGLLVGAGRRADGTVDAVGLDPRTGAEVWATPLSPAGPRTGGVTCETPGSPPRPEPVTACVVVDEMGAVDDASSAGLLQPTASRLVVLDPTTGRVVGEKAVEPSTSIASLGSDLVLGHLEDDGRLGVRRTDASGEEVRWSFTSPEVIEETEYGRWAWVRVVDGLVVAGGDSGWVLSAEGRPLHSWQPAPRGAGWADVLGNGLLVQPLSDGGLASEILDLRTSAYFRLDGRPLYTPLDDGSAGDTLLAQLSGDRLGAFDARTGRPLWTAPDAGTGGSGLLVAGGKVVRTYDGGLAALDATTGDPLWTTPVEPVTQYTLLTDGRLVLCVVEQPDRGQLLGAYGLDDGRLRWEVDLPVGLDHLFVVDGSLFAYADSELVALG